MLLDAPFDAAFVGATPPDDYVAQVIRLLRNAADDEYDTTQRPRVKQWWDDAQSERGPGADQPPILYVWSPTDTTLEQFSMDAHRYDETGTVEVQAWSLYSSEAKRLQQNITYILSKYLDDNRINTPYLTVQPTGESDFREQKPARQTDHYVMSVEIDLRGLQPTRDVDGTAWDFVFDGPFG